MRSSRITRTRHVFLSAALLAYAGSTNAQQVPITETMLVLAPYCTEGDRTQCPSFAVHDAERLRTEPLSAGDILDIEILVRSPAPQDVGTVRAWLQYDPTILSVRNVELLPAITHPIPGEQEADPSRGLVRIGGATAEGFSTQETSVARVTFQVLRAEESTEISFANYVESGGGETTVLSRDNRHILETEPSRLLVAFVGTVAPPPPSQEQELPPATEQETNGNAQAFGILQVQNVRVTSQDTSLFVAWDRLATPDVQGYNVYYGTVSGQYIQRRSVGRDDASLVIRNLETGTQYYVAVRAFDAQSMETAFSREQSVAIGRPETSTAPLVPGSVQDPVDRNILESHEGREVTGETGIHHTLLALLAAAAVIGTALAWKKQLSLSSQHA